MRGVGCEVGCRSGRDAGHGVAVGWPSGVCDRGRSEPHGGVTGLLTTTPRSWLTVPMTRTGPARPNNRARGFIRWRRGWTAVTAPARRWLPNFDRARPGATTPPTRSRSWTGPWPSCRTCRPAPRLLTRGDTAATVYWSTIAELAWSSSRSNGRFRTPPADSALPHRAGPKPTLGSGTTPGRGHTNRRRRDRDHPTCSTSRPGPTRRGQSCDANRSATWFAYDFVTQSRRYIRPRSRLGPSVTRPMARPRQIRGPHSICREHRADGDALRHLRPQPDLHPARDTGLRSAHVTQRPAI